jgi:tetratricopeptide (TPR) repeat protein
MFTSRRCSACLAIPILFCAFAVSTAAAQTQDLSDSETDPVKLFERGQDAHAKHDYKTAILLYESAIKLKPEFPEAELQRAMALLATNQLQEAIQGFHRAVALRPDWTMAYAKFGSSLSFSGNFDRDAEQILRKAIELDANNLEAIVALAVLRQRAGDLNEAVKLIRLATTLKDASAQTWRQQAFIEHLAGDKAAAVSSITRAINLEPEQASWRQDRARFLLELNDRPGALADLTAVKTTLSRTSDVSIVLDLAQLYAHAGKPDEGLRLLDALNEHDRTLPEVIALRAEISGDGGSKEEERAALEELLKRDPRNAALLARLGAAYRIVDPEKSQGYYYRALQIEPNNTKLATGYAAALVQSRHFADAVVILRKVLEKMPDDHVAHANLAIALYELKDYASALPEYEWLKNERPEVAVTYFYIATAHDKLGQYPDALTAYEKFLSLANSGTNQLEIEKVNLRLPSLRAQLKRGQGRKESKP